MPRTHEIPTFLPQTVPVEFVTELTSYEVDEQGIDLTCVTARYQPEKHDYYGTTCETMLRPPVVGDPVKIRLDFCTQVPHMHINGALNAFKGGVLQIIQQFRPRESSSLPRR